MPWSGEHRGFVVAAFSKISTFRAQLTNKIFATGLLKTLENSMHDLFTAQK
jgi:hypothetical protein